MALIASTSLATTHVEAPASAASATLKTPRARSAATPVAAATSAPGDPLESAECRRALAALNAEESAVAETSRAGGRVTANDRRLIDAKLAPARHQAARSCLARSADPATIAAQRPERPPPIATAPLDVAPASSPTPIPATARAAPPLAPPTARGEKPYAITSCDAGGCWANDGSRLNRVGPNLWGPRGVCTVQGSLVQCP